MKGKPTWVSWAEYLQQHSRHYEPLTLEPNDVAGLLRNLHESDKLRAAFAEMAERRNDTPNAFYAIFDRVFRRDA